MFRAFKVSVCSLNLSTTYVPIKHKNILHQKTSTIKKATWSKVVILKPKIERSIEEIKTSGKVRSKRTLLLLIGDDESRRSIPINYPNHFICKVVEKRKRKSVHVQ